MLSKSSGSPGKFQGSSKPQLNLRIWPRYHCDQWPCTFCVWLHCFFCAQHTCIIKNINLSFAFSCATRGFWGRLLKKLLPSKCSTLRPHSLLHFAHTHGPCDATGCQAITKCSSLNSWHTKGASTQLPQEYSMRWKNQEITPVIQVLHGFQGLYILWMLHPQNHCLNLSKTSLTQHTVSIAWNYCHACWLYMFLLVAFKLFINFHTYTNHGFWGLQRQWTHLWMKLGDSLSSQRSCFIKPIAMDAVQLTQCNSTWRGCLCLIQ